MVLEAEPIFFATGFFLLGAIIASFVGLVTARLYTGASVVLGRSVCDSCGVTLSPFALVPLLSWILARGRCLACSARVSASSTLTEGLLGALFVLAYLKLGLTFALPLMLIALALLLALVLYDLAHSILPPILLWPFVVIALVSATLSSSSLEAFVLTFLTALLLSSFLAVLHLASFGRAIGLADAPLVFGLALLVGGSSALSGLLFSFWIGGVIGIILLVRRALGTKIQSEVPFAPFLAAGFLLAYFTTWDAFTLVSNALLLVGV